MKRIFLGSLSAAALTLGAQTAFAEQHAGGGSGSEAMGSTNTGSEAMVMITCEEFLALPAQDQEMHATALTTANTGGTGGMSEGGSDATATDTGGTGGMSEGGSDATATDAGGSGSTETGSDSSGEITSDTGGSMATDGSAGGSGTDSTMQQSPTAVALVTICENTRIGGGSGMESGSGSGGASN